MKQYQKILLTGTGLFFGALLFSLIINFIFELLFHFLGDTITIIILIVSMFLIFLWLAKVLFPELKQEEEK